MSKYKAIQSTFTPPNRPPVQLWRDEVCNYWHKCLNCSETFRQKDIKTEYIADACGECVDGLSVCPFCGSDFIKAV